jgi:hypothetical protein
MEDETAAAAAASVGGGSAPPAYKEREILSRGEENVAGNLSAKTTWETKESRIPSAGAEELDRIFAADRDGEGLRRSGKREGLGVRPAPQAKIARADAPASRKAFVDLIIAFPVLAWRHRPPSLNSSSSRCVIVIVK